MATTAQKEDIHVLMVAFSAQGHINPMLRLAKRILSKGLRVSLATTEVARQRILKSSDPAAAANFVSGIELLFFSDGLSLDYNRGKNLDHYMDMVGSYGPINLTNLIKQHYSCNSHGRKLSCIINNPFVPWVADVAAELEIPCAMLWIQPCSIYALYYRFYNNLNPFPTPENPEMSVQIPGLPLLHTQDLPSFVLPSNPFDSFPKLLAQMFQNMNKYKWVLGNSFYELEKDAIDSMSEIFPVRPVGPLVPPSLLGEDDRNPDVGVEMWKPEETCIEWLNNHPPSSVIYISFGSITVLQAKEMDNIAKCLKNINRPFLWVVKPPEFSSPDGAGQLPTGFLEETKDIGRVVPWCPQTKVLANPSVACFITHCGWNSTLETVVSGVPVIGYPQWTDQPTNAKLIVDVFCIGLRVRPDGDGVVSSEEVEKSIEEIMVGPRSSEFKKNAAELKRGAREAVAEGGTSDRNIQALVDEIIENSLTFD